MGVFSGIVPSYLPWSPAALPLGHSSPLRLLGWPSSGINAPQLFVARQYSFFAWHTEDLDLFSCNMLHEGSAKTWYAVPAADRGKFEAAVEAIEKTGEKATGGGGDSGGDVLGPAAVPSKSAKRREAELEAGVWRYHRVFFTDPAELTRLGVACVRLEQQVGDMVLTMPGAYHSGFSHGPPSPHPTPGASFLWRHNCCRSRGSNRRMLASCRLLGGGVG